MNATMEKPTTTKAKQGAKADKPKAEFNIASPISLEHKYVQWLIDNHAKDYDFPFTADIERPYEVDIYHFDVKGGRETYHIRAVRRDGKFHPTFCSCKSFENYGPWCKHLLL